MPLPPSTPTIEAYITAVEQASSKLPTQEADEFRSDINKLLKQQQQQTQCNNQCNLNPTQCWALRQLKQDNSRVVLTVDKGWPWSSWTRRITPIKSKHYYKTPTPTKFLKTDPTSQLKNKLITLLKDIKQTGGLSTNKYKQLYPTSAVPSSSMAFPKFTKLAHPSSP